jgi:hypothetical protein
MKNDMAAAKQVQMPSQRNPFLGPLERA